MGRNLMRWFVVAALVSVLVATPGLTGKGTADAACPCSIWPNPVTPGFSYDNPNPIEMGLKFRSDVAGYVTGVRFFKATGATGTHIGRLWTMGGTKLAEVTFTGETASGWQTATFPSAVAIQAGTTYIVSYYVGDGNRRFSDTFDFFATAGVDNPPLHALAAGVDGPNGIFSDTGGWFNQSYRSSHYWVDVVFDDTPPGPDTTPPTVSGVAPANGATGVAATANVTVSFSEPMDPAAIGTGTVELRDPANNLVTASVSYVSGTYQAVLDPTSSLALATTYTGTVKSGSSGVKDLAGNALVADYTWTFTTESPDLTPPTVTSVVPANGTSGVLRSATVSVVFSEAMNTATIDGTTFALLDPYNTPVAASVAYDAGTRTATLTPSASLAYNTVYTGRVLGGPSGVKDLAGNPLAADHTWTFTTEAPDLTPPTVSSVMPINGVTRLRLATRATVRFSEAMDPGTVTAATIELLDPSSDPVPATVAYDAGSYTATLTPDANLAYSTTYTARVKGGPGGVKDALGNALAADYTWSFGTVAARPAVDHAPGGPILIIASSTNHYTRYFTEIVRTEGLNEFDLVDISALTAGVLAAHDVAILGEMTLTSDQVTLLADWVTAGGHLIASRPDKQLAGLLGLTDAATTLANGYLLIDNSRSPGTGIVGQTLQFHGTADAYTLNGATALATLYSDRATATAYPAVTLRSVGSSGGLACAFTFDLAKSIVWTHQGNPAWQTGHVNPLQGYGTALDLFYPDWIDFNRITIPQADEQQRFFANLILYANADKKPLPRFWYFPKGKKAAIILTGDDHWGRSSPSGNSMVFYERHKSQSPAGCSPDDWECIRSSSYGYEGNLMTDAQAAAYTAQGFEFGLHADAGLASGGGWCGTWPSDTQAKYAAQFEALMRKYASIPVQGSERDHCYSWFGYTGPAGWQGYAGIPEVEDGLGIRFDTNISYNPGSWASVNPGYQMGSGMMMRFAQVDDSGVMTKFLDIYNGGTQMNDDNGQGAAAMRTIVDAFLDNAVGPQGYYGGFVVNMHSDNWYGWSYDGSDQVVASAIAHQIPVVSGSQMVDWLDGRNSSSFGAITWDGTTMAFTVTVGAGARNLMGMLPYRVGPVPLAGLTRGGSPVTYTLETVKGVQYAFFPAAAGAYAAVYAPDTTPPAISAVAANPTSGQTATVTWTTNEPATSRVDYGTSPGALGPGSTIPALVTQHSVALSGLLPHTQYYYRVVSADESGNSATAPAAGSDPETFTTPSAGLIDTKVADFSAGTPDENLSISQMADGEVTLKPAISADFSGSSLPSGWSLVTGTSAPVSNGVVTLDGATVGPGSFYGAGQSVEAAATFTAGKHQHVGFGVTYQTSGGEAWAIISTGASGTGLLARCWTGSGGYDTQSTAIIGNYLGAPHRYRVDWHSSSIDYYVDGVLVATHDVAITTAMRPLLADGLAGDGASLTVDWLRMSPYAATGVFTSRVLDARGPATWEGLVWTSDVPASTSLSMQVRTGDSPDTGDPSWTGFTLVPTSGSPVGGQSRYVQYQASFQSEDPGATPVLYDVTILYGQDVVPPPEISAVAGEATSGQTATVAWSTDVPATSRVDYGTSAGALTANASDPVLVTSHVVQLTGLQPGTQYYFRVTSADGSGGSTTSPPAGTAPATFTTLPLSFFDTTITDFAAGTADANAYVSQMANGEVILKPELAAEFSGASLPAGWSLFTGPSATVGYGVLTVDGSTVGVTAANGAGHSVEASATFTAGKYQHLGFGVNFTAVAGDAWAIISTGAGGTGLAARSWTGSGAFDTQSTPITGSFFGAPHRYRVDWNSGSIAYYVDGVLVATHDVTISLPMRPLLADGSGDAAKLTVDWLRMSPYATPSVFTSRVFDAESIADWQTLSWTADVPSGTALAMSARGGNAADTNDPSWTGWQPIATSGGGVGIRSRYVQYRADLATTAPALTPALQDVSFTYGTPSSDIVAAAVPEGACISTAHACVAVPVTFTRGDATPVRAYSAVVHLSPELAVCGAGLVQGSYLGGDGAATFRVVDRGGGVYQVDEAHLGSPCGATGDGTLFTLHLSSAAASGTGTVTLDSVRVRDCANGPVPGDAGPPATIAIDNTAPAALTALTAALGTVGSDDDGRLALTVSFPPPGDGSAVAVYRKAYGNYPAYGPGGATPPAPTDYPPSGWTATAVTASGQSDDPPTRDFWYYVAYTVDECGNRAVSPVSGGALNYLLGDVVDGLSECAGNNLVDMADVSLLGTHYGRPVGTGGAPGCLDVGPTTDYALRSRPVPDGIVEFEDLVLFALNFGWTGSAPGVLPAARGGWRVLAAATADAVALAVPALPAVGGTFAVAVQASGAGDLQALSLALAYDPAVVEMVGTEAGPLLAAQAAPAVVLSPRAGRVDLALLGRGAGLTGTGELATVRFRRLAAGDPQLAIAAAEGRDGSNQKVAVGRTVAAAAALPSVTQLRAATPNPFSQTATLSFSLAQSGPVELAIYSVGGRRVRTLARGPREVGEYTAIWNGRDDDGNAMPAGVYFVRMQTTQGRFTRPVVLLK